MCRSRQPASPRERCNQWPYALAITCAAKEETARLRYCVQVLKFKRCTSFARPQVTFFILLRSTPLHPFRASHGCQLGAASRPE
jgi:hypothetical protein